MADRVRWGVLGPGRIADIALHDASRAANFSVVAAASRDPSRAAEFASRHGLERAYGSYEELLADPQVDAVYIGLPNALHHPWTMKALAAGKHVLCEKPYSRHPEQVEEAFAAADRAGRRLMEAFMWRHSPKTARFMELLPRIGEIQSISSAFSFRMEATSDARLDPAMDGGALMDVGCYAVSGSRLIAGSEPIRVFGVQETAPSGVDIRFSGMLEFGSGLVSQIVCGFTSEQRWLEATGVAGTLRSVDPWLDQRGGIELDGRAESYPRDDPYRLEMESLSDAILGRAEPLLGRRDALGQARTIDALLRSAALGRPVELRAS